MFEIRMAEKEDLSQIAQMESGIFSDAWSEKSLCDSFEQSWVWMIVAVKEKRVVGYLTFLKTGEDGEIARIAVRPEITRQGIGNHMLLKLENLCKDSGIKKMMLEVRESNETAVAFYKDFGFEEDGLRKNYYTNPTEHAILMSRELGR